MPASRRAAWGTISREQIVETALDVVRAGHYEQLTIRGLASQLGVAPMSLYRHVRDKDDLLDEVVDRLLADVWKPRARPDDVRGFLTEASERLRRFLVSQPAALRVVLRHPLTSPNAVARMEAMIDSLRQAGFTPRAARRAFATIQTYTIGFAALEASRERWVPRETTDAVARQLSSFTTPRQFAVGLQCLLDGLEQRRET